MLETRRERSGGHPPIVTRIEAPAIVGDLEVFYHCSRIVTIECIEDSVVALIRPNVLQELVALATEAVRRRSGVVLPATIAEHVPAAGSDAAVTAPRPPTGNTRRNGRNRLRTFTLPLRGFGRRSDDSSPGPQDSGAAAVAADGNGHHHHHHHRRRRFFPWRRSSKEAVSSSTADVVPPLAAVSHVSSSSDDAKQKAGASGAQPAHSGSEKTGVSHAAVSLPVSSRDARVAAVSAAAAALGRGELEPTAPDIVVRIMPQRDTRVITAGTAERLLERLAHSHYDPGDTTFAPDFFFSYRRFTSAEEVLRHLRLAAKDSAVPDGSAHVLALLEVWTQAPPFATDLDLPLEPELQGAIAGLASELAQGTDAAATVAANLNALQVATACRSGIASVVPNVGDVAVPSTISVHITRPGRVLGRATFMRFDTQPAMTLEDVLQRACKVAAERSTRFFKAFGDSSGGNGHSHLAGSAESAGSLSGGETASENRLKPSHDAARGSVDSGEGDETHTSVSRRAGRGSFMGDAGGNMPSCERNIYLDPSGYRFRSLLFGTELPRELRLAEAFLHEVEMAPLQTSSDSASGAPELKVNVLAQVLTRVEHALFAALSPRELLDQRWRRDRANAPLATAITRHFNAVNDWALSLILSSSHPAARARVLEQLIWLTDAFEKLKNFSGMVQIISALRHVAVRRLSASWAKVDVSTSNLLDVLEALVRPDNNRTAYRNKLHEVPCRPAENAPASSLVAYQEGAMACVPYLGVVLSDILFCEDGNKDVLPSYKAKGQRAATQGREKEEGIEVFNLYKYRALARVLEGMRVFQRRSFQPGELPEATPARVAHAQWVLAQQTTVSAQDIWERSCQCEPLVAGRGGRSAAANAMPMGSAPAAVSPVAVPSTSAGAMRGMEYVFSAVLEPKSAHRRRARGGVQANALAQSLKIDSAGIEATMRYLGSFSCPEDERQVEKIVKRAPHKVKPVASVSVGVSNEDTLVFTEVTTRDNVLRLHFRDILHVRMLYSERVCYVLEKTAAADNVCHVFLAQGNQPEDVYLAMQR